MINIVVPMAGRGSRLAAGGEGEPKPLIQVTPGRRMIEYVVRRLALDEPHRFTFVCLREHARTFDFEAYFRSLAVEHALVMTDEVTRGPACTALLAAPFIGNDDEVLISYCDSFITIDPTSFISTMRARRADGGILTYPSVNPWDSYAEVSPNGRVLRTTEKVRISGAATAGLYYFRRGLDFVAATQALADEPLPTQEVFVCPVYNVLIRQGKAVFAYPIGAEQQVEMGTPQDLARARHWLASTAAQRIAGSA